MYYTGAVHKTRDAKKGQNPPPPPPVIEYDDVKTSPKGDVMNCHFPHLPFVTIEKEKYHTIF